MQSIGAKAPAPVCFAGTLPLMVSEDFENWNVNGWASVGSPLITNAAARSGNFGMRIISDAADDRDFIYKYFSDKNRFHLTAYLRFNSLTVNYGVRRIIYVENGNALAQFILVFRKNVADGKVYFEYLGALTPTYERLTEVGEIQLGKWYKVEVRLVRDSVNGCEALYIDDVLLKHKTGNSDLGGAITGHYYGMITFPVSGEYFNFDYDDIVVRGD
jgi:hypothetical protein